MADELQTKRIIDLAQKTGPEAGDNLAVDNATSGTRRILWENLLDDSLSDDTKAAPAGVTGQAIEDARTTFTDLNEGNVVVNYDEDETAGPDTPLRSIRFPLLPYRYTVPAIDPTLTQSGQAADAKVVGDEIERIKSELNDIGSKQLNFIETTGGNRYNVSTVTRGKYITNSGDETENNSYAVTDFIPVKEGDVIRYTLISSLSDQHSQLYNSSKEWVQSTRWIKTNYDTYQEVTIPSGISYIRINMSLSYIPTYVVTINESYDSTLGGTYGYKLSFDDFYSLNLPQVEILEEALNSISPSQLNFVNAVTNVFDSSTLSTGYIGNTGTIESNSSFRYTDFIPVKSGDKVRFTYNSDLSTQSCQYYDVNKSFFGTGRYVTTAIDSTYQESTVPNGAEYIRINLKASQINDFVVVINSAYDSSLAGNTNTTITLKDGYIFDNDSDDVVKLNTVSNGYFLKKICCIGDSLTEGQYGVNSTTQVDVGKHDGYPYFLARMLNCDVENLGIGGKTTKTWWQEKENYFTQTQLDFSKYDCFIIFLGTNGGLAGNPDPDEDSMLGYYCKIIDACRTGNAQAPIFLVGFPWSQNRTADMVSQLETLATAKGLPILHLESSEILTYANRFINQPFDKALHYGRLGYLRLASEIKRCIQETIKKSPSYYAEIVI